MNPAIRLPGRSREAALAKPASIFIQSSPTP